MTQFKKNYGHNIEEEYNLFMRGELCLIVEFQDKGICYLFLYGSDFVACDGLGYFQKEAFGEDVAIKYLLNARPCNRVKLNLEEIIFTSLNKIMTEQCMYKYYSCQQKSWTYYKWEGDKFIREVIPLSEKKHREVYNMSDNPDKIICEIVSRTIEKIIS
jgi:hypothetical protein